MGKRYYCDYCDRTFADSPVNRKKHVNGVQHQRNRKLHYDSFKDPAQLLAEESQKIPCKRFFQSGNCGFGVNCRFSHTNPQLLLEQAAQQNQPQSGPEPRIHVWLDRWEKKKKFQKDHKTKQKTSTDEDDQPERYMLPPNLPPLPELPPSLLPPPPGGHTKVPRLEWG